MEKFALLDFLKAFESLAPKQTAANPAADKPEPAPAQPSPTAPAAQSAPAAPEIYETNVMANVLSRHEEIANRIKNKRSV